MPELKDLLQPEQAKRMVEAVRGPRELTTADSIEIDPNGEALIEAECVDCKDEGTPTMVLLRPDPPKGVPADMPRVPVCQRHGLIRANAALAQGRTVEVIHREPADTTKAIHRPKVKKHKPRITDGLDHAVSVINTNTPKEATSMTATIIDLASSATAIDISKLSDAEFGALVRKQMLAQAATATKAASEPVKKARKDKAKKQKAERTERQAARKAEVPLPAFRVDSGLVVPTLDLRDVRLNEQAPGVIRSNYNKARFRLAKDKTSDEAKALPTTATFKLLRDEHLRLAALAAARQQERAAKQAEPKPKKIAAEVDLDAKAMKKAQVKAIMEHFGVSKPEAKQILAKIS